MKNSQTTDPKVKVIFKDPHYEVRIESIIHTPGSLPVICTVYKGEPTNKIFHNLQDAESYAKHLETLLETPVEESPDYYESGLSQVDQQEVNEIQGDAKDSMSNTPPETYPDNLQVRRDNGCTLRTYHNGEHVVTDIHHSDSGKYVGQVWSGTLRALPGFRPGSELTVYSQMTVKAISFAVENFKRHQEIFLSRQKVRDLVNEYKKDHGSSPAQWIQSKDVTPDERSRFLYELTGFLHDRDHHNEEETTCGSCGKPKETEEEPCQNLRCDGVTYSEGV